MEIVIFLFGTLCFIWLSRHSLLRPGSHGFSRFFAFECILALIILNLPMWNSNSSSLQQVLSWILLTTSLGLVLNAVYRLIKFGKPSQKRHDEELLPFERTSVLVTSGVFSYIRHPMYASLLFLAWGVFFKSFSLLGLTLVSVASIAIFITALRDEVECQKYFGDAYSDYMKTNKRFIPFIF